MNIFWFRRDLRINDNKGLFEALKSKKEVLPIFIFDRTILDELQKDDSRVSFIHELIDQLDTEFQKNGKNLAVFYGEPLTVFEQLVKENKIETVFTNHDYEPYARKRDESISSFLAFKNIGFKTFKDQVIFEKNEMVKENQTPYVVFTPYSKKWKENFKKIQLEHFKSEDLLSNIIYHSYPFLRFLIMIFQKT